MNRMKKDTVLPESEIIQAAGGIVWRKADGRKEIAIVYRARYDDWSLPKGKLKRDEEWQAGAQREVEEEIQCTVSVGKFAGCCCYEVGGVPKVVLFWHMQLLEDGEFRANKEIDQLVWLPIDRAMDKLDYEFERNLVESNQG